MWAVRVEEPNKLALVEVPVPQPGPNDLLVKIKRAGICGSDMHILHGKNPFAKYPRVIGHEVLGTVAELGSGVSGFSVGDRVVLNPVVACGHCHACRIGRPNVCRDLEVIGVHRDGGMSEFCALPAANAFKVPDNVSDRDAVMAEPYSIAANVMVRSEANDLDIALIYGAGVVGLTCLQAAVMKGVRCIVTDIDDRRLERASALGAARIVNTRREDVAPVVAEMTGGFGVTLVIDGAGAPGLLEQSLQLAGPTARIMVLNFQPGASAVPQAEIVKKELSLLGSRLNRGLIPQVLDWLSSGKIKPASLITHELDFRQAAEAMQLIESHPEEVCKVQLTFG